MAHESDEPTYSLNRSVNCFWVIGDDPAEDYTLRAGTDEHQWVYLELDEDRVLALRPSDLLKLIASATP